MFSLTKFSAAVLAFAAVARAEIFITSYSVQINGSSTVTWVSTDPDNDPTLISVQLGNPTFHRTYAIATTVPTTQMTLTLSTPSLIPGPGYTVQINKIDDVNTVYAQTTEFALVDDTVQKASSLSAGPPTTSTSSTSSASSTASSAAATTGTGIGATNGTASASSPAASATSPAVTAPSTSATGTGTGTNTAQIPGTSSGASSSSNTNNSAAVGLVPAGAAAAIMAGVAALFL